MLDFDHGFDMHDDSVVVFARQNGLVGGTVQELRLPPGCKLSDFLEKASKALGMDAPQRAFHSNGVECTDVDNIDESEVMHISSGEPFRICERQGAGSQIVGNYLVQEKLGQGGFGAVFKAVHLETGEAAAVKFVSKSSFVGFNDLQRVYQEIQSLRELRHPNVIRILGTADHPDNVCFFMEFCAGGELRGYVERKVFLSEDESRHFFKQLVRAVHYIHGKKIIHRDLKMENILLDAAQRLKIVDFGLAGYVAHNERTITDAGTEAYLAPEVYNGTSDQTDPYKLDVWALGVILYALAHGKLPFSRPDKETCDRLASDSLPTYKEDLSSGFRRIVRVQLIPKPAKRASVNDLSLDSWTTNNRFGPCGQEEKDDDEAPLFVTEDPEIASNSDLGVVLEDDAEYKRSQTAPVIEVRKLPLREKVRRQGSQPAGPSSSPCPSPGRIVTARSDLPPPSAVDDGGPTPRLRPHKRGGKGSSGTEKALINAGAQVIGQRPGGGGPRSGGAAPPSQHRGLQK